MGKSAINPAVVGRHSTDIAALKNDLGIVEDGNTATHTIAQGQYVIWQGALYTADAAIASGTTLAASGGNKNLTAVENGGLNALNSSLNEVTEFNVTPNSGYNITDHSAWHGKSYKVGNKVYLNVCFQIPNNMQGGTIATIPEGFRPRTDQTVPVGSGIVKAAMIHSSTGQITGYVDAGNLAINISYLV